MLIKPSDEASEAQRYAEVLAELFRSPERRRAMGAAGRQRIRDHYQLDQMGEKLVACLAAACALQSTQPRPAPDRVLGRVCAAQAVEYIRLSDLADQLWAERHGLQPVPPERRTWRHNLYQRLYRWHEPIYYWYTRRGWTWLSGPRAVLKRLLLNRADKA